MVYMESIRVYASTSTNCKSLTEIGTPIMCLSSGRVKRAAVGCPMRSALATMRPAKR